MLEKVDFPLTNGQISEFILDKGYTTYFTLQQAISEMVEAGFIREESTHNRTMYHLTEEGASTIEYFATNISATIRHEIDDFLAEKAYWLNQYINRRKSNDPLPQVLKAIFDFMKKNDIIYEQIPNSRKFTITGKIDYIYEVLSYIDSHEQILEESTPKIIQEELF